MTAQPSLGIAVCEHVVQKHSRKHPLAVASPTGSVLFIPVLVTFLTAGPAIDPAGAVMCTPIGSTSTSATGTVIWNCVTGSTPGDVVISVTADPTGDHQMPEAGLGSALCGWEKLCWHVTCAAVCAVPACLPAPGTPVSASLNVTIGTDCVGAFGEFEACSSVCADVTGERSQFFNVVSAPGTQGWPNIACSS